MQRNSQKNILCEIQWQWQTFATIGGSEMHEMLAVRQQVFVVEQRCAYLDADTHDHDADHLTGRAPTGELVVYARLNRPGSRLREPSIGRLLTTKSFRCQELASEAMKRAITKSFELYPDHDIRISAQLYLKQFYARYGFVEEGQSYFEDGIEHIDMILQTNK